MLSVFPCSVLLYVGNNLSGVDGRKRAINNNML